MLPFTVVDPFFSFDFFSFLPPVFSFMDVIAVLRGVRILSSARRAVRGGGGEPVRSSQGEAVADLRSIVRPDRRSSSPILSPGRGGGGGMGEGSSGGRDPGGAFGGGGPARPDGRGWVSPHGHRSDSSRPPYAENLHPNMSADEIQSRLASGKAAGEGIVSGVLVIVFFFVS